MAQSAAALKSIGEMLWRVRTHGVPAEVDGHRVWYERAWDMNQDGAVTVSDSNLWFEWAFALPGDYITIAIMRWLPEVGQFIELSADSINSWGSWAVSALVWLIGWGLYSSLMDTLSSISRKSPRDE